MGEKQVVARGDSGCCERLPSVWVRGFRCFDQVEQQVFLLLYDRHTDDGYREGHCVRSLDLSLTR